MLSLERGSVTAIQIDAFPDTSRPRVDIAVATLRRAASFVETGMLPLVVPAYTGHGAIRDGLYWPRTVGNALRELDRFLSILVDEVAHAIGLPEADRLRLSRQRNTANKLRAIYRALGLASVHHDRLRAMVRCSACLLYCAGTVRRADARGGEGMTVAWPGRSPDDDRPPPRLMIGDRLVVEATDLADIGRFYAAAAIDLQRAGDNLLLVTQRPFEKGQHRGEIEFPHP